MAKAIAKPAISAEQKQKNKKQLRIQIKRHWMLYLFLLPCIVWLLVFCYAPMAGIVLAFKNYRFDLGIFGSEWAGLKHFRKFVTSPEFWMTIKKHSGNHQPEAGRLLPGTDHPGASVK